MTKIPIAVSSCLLGEKVRYDGDHKFNSRIVLELNTLFEYHSYCPEMAIGLGVPRPPIHLVNQDSDIRCVGVDIPHRDVTTPLQQYARDISLELKHSCGYIFKKGSPSCGIHNVKVNQIPQPYPVGMGIYAKTIMQRRPLLPVIDELCLENAVYRENFILRTQLLYLWYNLQPDQLNVEKLLSYDRIIRTQFQLKIAYDNQQLLFDINENNLADRANCYLSEIARQLPTFPDSI